MPSEKIEEETEGILNERHYRDLLIQLPEGVGITDLHENLIFVNKEFASMLGYDPSNLIGRNLSEFVEEKELNRIRTETSKRRVGVSSVYNVKMTRKDGGEIVVKVSAVPRRDDQDNVIGTMAVVSDITIEKEREFEQVPHLWLSQIVRGP